MMDKQDMQKQINAILIEELSINNPDEVKPEAKLAEDLGADSLDAIEITMAIERQFDISISDYQMHQMSTSATVQDVYAMVEEALK